tara:strand:+ start:10385 stop:11023 length:639 start_codon:yes stop_codon:yes gene_type:complete
MSSTPQVENLLDFIGDVESEQGYDIEFGNNPLDLSNMTIKEVLEHQEKRRAEGVESSAVGRYQFIYETLKGLVYTEDGKEKNPTDLPEDALFTPEVQDKAATILLQRRGLDKYLSGDMSAEDFAIEVAKEWASMPIVRDTTVKRVNKEGLEVLVDLKKGQSYYAGVGSNQDRVDVDEFLDVIKETQLQEIQVDPKIQERAVQANTFVEAMQQ